MNLDIVLQATPEDLINLAKMIVSKKLTPCYKSSKLFTDAYSIITKKYNKSTIMRFIKSNGYINQDIYCKYRKLLLKIFNHHEFFVLPVRKQLRSNNKTKSKNCLINPMSHKCLHQNGFEVLDHQYVVGYCNIKTKTKTITASTSFHADYCDFNRKSSSRTGIVINKNINDCNPKYPIFKVTALLTDVVLRADKKLYAISVNPVYRVFSTKNQIDIDKLSALMENTKYAEKLLMKHPDIFLRFPSMLNIVKRKYLGRFNFNYDNFIDDFESRAYLTDSDDVATAKKYANLALIYLACFDTQEDVYEHNCTYLEMLLYGKKHGLEIYVSVDNDVFNFNFATKEQADEFYKMINDDSCYYDLKQKLLELSKEREEEAEAEEEREHEQVEKEEVEEDEQEEEVSAAIADFENRLLMTPKNPSSPSPSPNDNEWVIIDTN